MKLLVIGDSWSSAVVAGNDNHGGWPVLLGILADLRQAVAGSTAKQWAMDFEGRLSKAAATDADVAILSLLGNDVFAALGDGIITPAEISDGITNFRSVVERVRKKRTIVILYTDPFFGRDKRFAYICPLLNATIRLSCPSGVEFFDTSLVLRPEHFDGVDIHPNLKGHEAIAAGLKKVLESK